MQFPDYTTVGVIKPGTWWCGLRRLNTTQFLWTYKHGCRYLSRTVQIRNSIAFRALTPRRKRRRWMGRCLCYTANQPHVWHHALFSQLILSARKGRNHTPYEQRNWYDANETGPQIHQKSTPIPRSRQKEGQCLVPQLCNSLDVPHTHTHTQAASRLPTLVRSISPSRSKIYLVGIPRGFPNHRKTRPGAQCAAYNALGADANNCTQNPNQAIAGTQLPQKTIASKEGKKSEETNEERRKAATKETE